MNELITTNIARKIIKDDLDTNFYVGVGLVRRLFFRDESHSSHRFDTKYWIKRPNYNSILEEIQDEHAPGRERHEKLVPPYQS